MGRVIGDNLYMVQESSSSEGKKFLVLFLKGCDLLALDSSWKKQVKSLALGWHFWVTNCYTCTVLAHGSPV